MDRDAAGDERVDACRHALRERAPDVVLLVPAGLPEEAGPATQAVRTLLQDVRAALPASRSAVLAAVTGDGAQDARLARAVRAAGAAERVGVVDPTGAGWYAGPYAGLVPGGPQTTDAAAAEAYTARRLAHALAPLVNAALEGKPCATLTLLSSLRDRDGRPNRRVRALAVVVALLLAGPLTLFLVGAVQRVLGLAY